jgi:hypothetical protein
MTIYRLFRTDSDQIGWALERDGQIIRTHPSAAVLGAYLDAHHLRRRDLRKS